MIGVLTPGSNPEKRQNRPFQGGYDWDTARDPPKTIELDPFPLSVTISNPSAPTLFFSDPINEKKKRGRKLGLTVPPQTSLRFVQSAGVQRYRPATHGRYDGELSAGAQKGQAGRPADNRPDDPNVACTISRSGPGRFQVGEPPPDGRVILEIRPCRHVAEQCRPVEPPLAVENVEEAAFLSGE